jgi:hypothetical protein
MDKAAYDRMRAAPKSRASNTSKTPKAVAVKPQPAASKQQPKNSDWTGPRKVDVHPAMLKKMKAAKQAKT